MSISLLPDNSDKTILIIDDTPANVAVLAEYLERENFQVLVAQDGEEGLERAPLARPDLILLDVMMPGISGFQTCQRLKTMESTKNIPIIFMTALTSTEDKVTGFEMGGIDYVTKPLQVKEVLARVNMHLNMHAMQKQLALQNQELVRANKALSALNEKLSQAQVRLLQSEKLASIGQLAAGVAHEINNPIGFVLSNLGSLQTYVDALFRMLCEHEETGKAIESADARRRLQSKHDELEIDYLKTDIPALLSETLDGATRIKQIVQDLKDFSHVDAKRDWQYANLHRGIDSTLNIIANEIKYKADVVKQYGQIPDIECLPSQLNQVVMNLVINAAHAIGNERGTITIRTGVERDDVWIEISDTGSGISKENLLRIFEPFFTTKPIGQGTGLGLSLSYGIVQAHGGHIDVQSEIGKGTRMRVCLPIRQAAASRN